ncbi:DUF4259 domain-containing protein [Actinocorallia sp. B10E7]|uniref:DUF4259 domain-containing protein n=1 Tax=Actinocorallia sp. B10E7 TaxID=3153558 RepID=UPI00325E14BA
MEEGKAWWETVTPVLPWNAPGLGHYPGPFDSDEASDDLAGIAEATDVQAALTAFLADFGRTSDRIYSDDTDGPVAAACLVAARLSGRALDEDAQRHLEEILFSVTEDLRALAAAALDRVVRPGDNEYYEWCEDDPAALADWLGQLAWYRAFLSR